MQEKDEQLNVSELVLYIDRSIAAIYRDLKKGFPAPSKIGNRVYWKKEEVDDYMLKLLNKGKNDVLGNE